MTKTTQSVSLISLYESEKDLIINKRTGNKEKSLRLSSSIIKIFVISIVFILLAAIVISIFTIRSMKTISLKSAFEITAIDNTNNKKDMTTIEEIINANIVKYIIKMTVITFIILLAFVILFGLGYKYKFLSHKVK